MNEFTSCHYLQLSSLDIEDLYTAVGLRLSMLAHKDSIQTMEYRNLQSLRIRLDKLRTRPVQYGTKT